MLSRTVNRQKPETVLMNGVLEKWQVLEECVASHVGV